MSHGPGRSFTAQGPSSETNPGVGHEREICLLFSKNFESILPSDASDFPQNTVTSPIWKQTRRWGAATHCHVVSWDLEFSVRVGAVCAADSQRGLTPFPTTSTRYRFLPSQAGTGVRGEAENVRFTLMGQTGLCHLEQDQPACAFKSCVDFLENVVVKKNPTFCY